MYMMDDMRVVGRTLQLQDITNVPQRREKRSKTASTAPVLPRIVQRRSILKTSAVQKREPPVLKRRRYSESDLAKFRKKALRRSRQARAKAQKLEKVKIPVFL